MYFVKYLFWIPVIVAHFAISYYILFVFSAVFHESTIRALEYYSYPDWIDTAKFMMFILNTWKIVNVKTLWKGKFIYTS